jgi:hypothetical protein
MLTLNSTIEMTKNGLKWLGIAVAAIILVILLYRGGKATVHFLFPKPPTPPTVSFGKLPQLLFPPDNAKVPFTYQLDTVSGTLGTFPDRAKVYKAVEAIPNLLNLQTARENVGHVGFTDDETVITDTIYSWHDEQKSDKVITYNIVSNDFSIASNYFTYPEILTPINLPTEDQANVSVQNFLDTMGILPKDIDTSKTTDQLLGIQNTSLYPASSLSTSQLVRVDLFQQDLDKLPIYYQDPPNSSMYFLVGDGGSTGDDAQIVESNFSHQSISNASATYPIKPVDQAFDELKKGKGYIAAYYGTGKQISIKNVLLAYYMGNEKQDYVIPIYVFSGRDGFYGYVVAVTDEWFKR